MENLIDNVSYYIALAVPPTTLVFLLISGAHLIIGSLFHMDLMRKECKDSIMFDVTEYCLNKVIIGLGLIALAILNIYFR